jgi:DUF1365 family protein
VTATAHREREAITPSEYLVNVTHRRRDPIEYGFAQRGNTWLIDLDSVPELPRGLRWLVNFGSRDHLGDGLLSLRQNIDAFLAEQGLSRPAAILMLANPRVLGYVFNPLSVFYCYDSVAALRTGTASHVVAEVRNTYGGRHSYLLTPDSDGKADTDKAFYVSPFYPVDGRYTMRLPVPTVDLLVNVTLHRAGERPFAAVLTGRRRHVGSPSSLWSALRTPLATRAVMFGIKRHGIHLYAKGLRPVPRTVDDTSGAEQPAATCPHHESGSR